MSKNANMTTFKKKCIRIFFALEYFSKMPTKMNIKGMVKQQMLFN